MVYYTVFGIWCRMHNRVNYLMLRCTISSTNDQQLHHYCHLMTLGVQVRLLISWHQYVIDYITTYDNGLQDDYNVHKCTIDINMLKDIFLFAY